MKCVAAQGAGNTDLHLVTIPYEDRQGAFGGGILLLLDMPLGRKVAGREQPFRPCHRQYIHLALCVFPDCEHPDMAAALVFGKHTRLAAIQKSLTDAHYGRQPKASRRAAIRTCRLCIDTSPPLIYVGAEGAAAPLFHEEGNTNASCSSWSRPQLR